MRIKDLLKKILSHPFLAKQKLGIAQFILTSEKAPQFIKNFVFKARNYLPRKKVVSKIKIDKALKAIFDLDLQSYGDREIFYNRYEISTVTFYKKVLKQKSIVWDIGSNIGFYVVIAGVTLKEKGEVFAFEPVPINFNSLSKNVELNGLTNVKLFNIALSSGHGEAEIYLLDTDRTTSSPTLNKEWAKSSGLGKQITIKTRSAMSLLSEGEVKRPDIIKIDAETHEPIIIEDIKPILMEDNAPDIICELMPPTIEPLSKLLIEQCKYSFFHISPTGLKSVTELKMRRPYNDYFFSKRTNLLAELEQSGLLGR